MQSLDVPESGTRTNDGFGSTDGRPEMHEFPQRLLPFGFGVKAEDGAQAPKMKLHLVADESDVEKMGLTCDCCKQRVLDEIRRVPADAQTTTIITDGKDRPTIAMSEDRRRSLRSWKP